MSFKYRIALDFFLLMAVMMAFTLWLTLSRSFDENIKHQTINEDTLIKQVLDVSRIALFTSEFDDLQPYIEQVVDHLHVVQALVADSEGRVLVSSDVFDLGKTLPKFEDGEGRFWRTQPIQNTSGTLGLLAIHFSHTELINDNRRALELGVFIAVASTIVAAVVGLFIGSLLTRRLRKLSDAASQIADGKLDVRVGLEGGDEVAIVGRAFDEMAHSISDYVQELHRSEANLREAHTDLENRVMERTRELAIARDEALEASQAKSRFLASMSHELRTPLNAIIGYSELLREEAEDRQQSVFIDDLRRINASGTHLLSLISNILDLSRIEAGKMDFALGWFELKPFLEDMLQTLHPLMKDNHNIFSADYHDYHDDLGSMYADKTRLRQVLINLLSNATRYAAHKKIILDVSRVVGSNGHWIVFKVADEGVGMESDQLKELFHEFSQLDSTVTDQSKGTGLGLAISQKICVGMGGEITVKSKLGKGTVFTVRLPAEVRINRVA